MDPFLDVQQKLESLEYLIRTNVNDDSNTMLKLLSEIKSSVKTVYLTHPIVKNVSEPTDSLFNLYNNRLVEQRTIIQPEVEPSGVLGVTGRPMPIFGEVQNLCFQSTDQADDMPLYSSRYLQNDYPKELSDIRIEDGNAHINTLHSKINMLKYLMNRNNIDTNLLDDISLFLNDFNV
jgi:hypothetical protein